MSSTLMWRPHATDGGPLSYELKRTMSRKLWDTDGTCGGGDAVLNESLIPYIEGLRDAGVKGADHLLDLLEKHGSIIVWHEH